MVIRVSRPHMPNRRVLDKFISDIYENKWITNFGPLENQLRDELAEYFGVESVALICNATVAIESLLSAVAVSEDTLVHTTPYSFKATSSAIRKNNLLPQYCDIISHSDVRMNPKKIHNNNELVLDTHVYGIPSLMVENTSNTMNRVIFDAAHCFDVFQNNKHLATMGTASVVSLHATKLVNSIEGGVVVSSDTTLIDDIRDRSNFALNSNGSRMAGNHKMSEFHAAFGLASLRELDLIIQQRQSLKNMYDGLLENAVCLCKPLKVPSLTYYPIIFHTRLEADRFRAACMSQKIEVRQYFDVALNTIYSDQKCPNAESLAGRIICLPMSSQFTIDEVKYLQKKLAAVMANDIY